MVIVCGMVHFSYIERTHKDYLCPTVYPLRDAVVDLHGSLDKYLAKSLDSKDRHLPVIPHHLQSHMI